MTDIVIEDVTTGTIDGTGIFDKLMVSVKSHIQVEFDKGRIKGTDYANVYLGVMQAVLAQSIEFALREKQTEAQINVLEVDKAAKQYELDSILPLQRDKAEEDVKLGYVTRVGKDKEVAGMGLDLVTKGNNATPPSVYTPKYEV